MLVGSITFVCGPRGKGSVLALDSARVYRDFWIPASYKPGPKIAATPKSSERRSPGLMYDHTAYLEFRMRQSLVEKRLACADGIVLLNVQLRRAKGPADGEADG